MGFWRNKGLVKVRRACAPVRRLFFWFSLRFFHQTKKTPVAAVWRSPPSRDCSESNTFFQKCWYFQCFSNIFRGRRGRARTPESKLCLGNNHHNSTLLAATKLILCIQRFFDMLNLMLIRPKPQIYQGGMVLMIFVLDLSDIFHVSHFVLLGHFWRLITSGAWPSLLYLLYVVYNSGPCSGPHRLT